MALALMCGLSFSGKSTFATRLARELDGHLISLDLINAERGLDGGQGIPVDEWAKTNRIAHDRAETLLCDGQDVVVDDTGSPRFIRDRWRAAAERAGAPFALVWIQIDPDLQRERVLANRSLQTRNDVVDAVLVSHGATFEPPTDESPIIVNARETKDAQPIRDVRDAIRQLNLRWPIRETRVTRRREQS